jgi:putative endonuclease
MRLGPAGEKAAARHLRSHGYRILARNFRAAGAEVDLVALDGETLVFVEVKTRMGGSRGTPQEAVDQRKQERIRRAGAIFAARNRAHGRSIRFDVIAVTGEGKARRFEIVRDAF